MTYCAICADPIPASGNLHLRMRPLGKDDALVAVCASCDEDVVDTSTPERLQRGYDAPGGVGVRFEQELATVHDRVVPAAVVALDRAPVVRAASEPVSPGWRGMSHLQRQYQSSNKSRNRSIRPKDAVQAPPHKTGRIGRSRMSPQKAARLAKLRWGKDAKRVNVTRLFYIFHYPARRSSKRK